MQPVTPKNVSSQSLMVYFDLECTQDSPISDNVVGSQEVNEHIPNLCVVQQSCDVCVDSDNMSEFCSKCGIREYIFRNDPIKDFFEYLCLPFKNFKSIIIIAHNLKSYDGHFILRYMVDKLKWTPDLIISGTKIMSIRVNNLHFLDSLSFMPMRLSKLPGAFNLDEKKFKKGFFPHFFNTNKNKNYIGPLPSKEMYGCDNMSVDERKQFDDWYNREVKRNITFNFQKELIEYCITDVAILRKACSKFRKIFFENNNVDIFTNAITIASACMYTFRQNYLKPNTIAIVPPQGYRCADRQSYKATVWLLWEEKIRGIHINHAYNGRETNVLGFKVDGYGEIDKRKLIFEFNGCYYHGCIRCYPINRGEILNKHVQETMAMRYESTQRKKSILEADGYEVIEMWECDFDNECTRNENLNKFVSAPELLACKPIFYRDAFYGGRCECFKTFYEINENLKEEIHYLDVTSLYPFVNKYGHYPIGHPEIFLNDNCPSVDNFEGIIKCTILPPVDLYIPVLPMKINKKCMFVLCYTCALNMTIGECNHTDSERELTGTWVVDEVRLAITHGYTIQKVYEVWKFQMSQYDPNSNSPGLFSEYVNNFLKIKQESSDWPDECDNNDELKDLYLKNFYKREGVQLDKSKIKNNPELRSLAKLQLNSFWGRFGMRNDLQRTTLVSSYNELLKYITNPSIDIKSCFPINEDVLYINWKHNNQEISSSPTTNIFMAAYTTTLARIHLYSIMSKLGSRLLYCDTDSVIFTYKSGEWEPEKGNYLGQMTDELKSYGRGSYIDTFVSGGPKNYAYRVRINGDKNNTKTVCKAKGVTIDCSTVHQVNFETLKRMVTEETDPVVLNYPNRFVRLKHWRIGSRHEIKTYRTVYTKRKHDDTDSQPYGSKKDKRS